MIDMVPINLIVIFASCSIVSGDSSPYSTLRKNLLTNYDPHIRPVKNAETATDLAFLVTFSRLINVDTKSGEVSFESFMILNWTDQFLQWNPSDYQGVDRINLSPDQIWKPNIVASTSLTQYYEEDNLDLEVNSKGHVIWVRILVIAYRCAMDLRDYPFDEQHCFFPVYIRFDSAKTVNIIPFGEIKKPAINFAHSTNPEWTVSLDRNGLTNVTTGNDTKPFIYISMVLKRKSTAYHYIVVMPYLASNFLLLYAFLLPFGSRKRIILASISLFIDMSLLTLIGYQLGFDSNHNVPYAVKCLSINMLMIGIFIAISVLGGKYLAKSTSDPPLWVQGLLKNRFLEKFLFIHLSAKELKDLDTEMAKMKASPSQSPAASSSVQPNDWNLLTTIVDRFYLIVYLIVFIVYHS